VGIIIQLLLIPDICDTGTGVQFFRTMPTSVTLFPKDPVYCNG